MQEPERQVERFIKTDKGVMKVMLEGLKCGTGHLFLEKFLRDDGSGGQMCPHCDSTELVKSTLLDPDAQVPRDVLELFEEDPGVDTPGECGCDQCSCKS